MPSFRASLAVIRVTGGRSPAEVLAAAQAGIATSWHVEDGFVDVDPLRRGGLPRVTVRFVVPWSNNTSEDATAWQAARQLATHVGQVAQWRDLRVFRRTKGRWDAIGLA